MYAANSKLPVTTNLAVSSTLGDLLENSLVGDLAEVGTLNLGVNASQGTAKSVFRRGVDHLGLDTVSATNTIQNRQSSP